MADSIDEFTVTERYTTRGFALVEFFDRNGNACSLQKSSSAAEDLIWLGIDYADPQIMASQTPEGGTGWRPYPIPEGVSLTTRMHLTQEMAAALIPRLQHFVETGELEVSPSALAESTRIEKRSTRF